MPVKLEHAALSFLFRLEEVRVATGQNSEGTGSRNPAPLCAARPHDFRLLEVGAHINARTGATGLFPAAGHAHNTGEIRAYFDSHS
jgi:hypothetical protein